MTRVPRASREAPAGTAVARAVLIETLPGPRFGFTTLTGETAEARQNAKLSTVMTQFGW